MHGLFFREDASCLYFILLTDWLVQMPVILSLIPLIQILDSEFELSYARSSGPGGQNVNKVNSKALLRWNLYDSTSMGLDLKARVAAKLGDKLTTEGDILISSDRFRDQIRNREDCFEKFRDLLASALERPKARKKTKPSRSSERRGKENKSRHSEKKSARAKYRAED